MCCSLLAILLVGGLEALWGRQEHWPGGYDKNSTSLNFAARSGVLGAVCLLVFTYSLI